LESPQEYSETRRSIYRLIASIFEREPTVDLLGAVRTSGLLSRLAEAGYESNDLFETTDLEKLTAELECEFAQLFVGPGPHVSPHESVHSLKGAGRGLLWGEVTVEVKKFIEHHGLGYSPDSKEIPDHLSVELEFMARLIDKELELRSSDDDKNVDHCWKVEREFFREHLLSWVPRFCQQVIGRAKLPFYREISKFLKDFMNSEEEFFSETEIHRGKMT
jgi:TorA maturation chaperone TorD